MPQHPHRRATRRNPIPSPNDDAERAHPLVRITQLTPAYSGFPGKVIHQDGRIEDYPKIAQWTWKQITIREPFDIFDLVRFNAGNSILIRGTPQDTTLSITRRKKASDAYPTGFTDTPTAWFPLDIDGAPLPSGVNWLTDPDRRGAQRGRSLGRSVPRCHRRLAVHGDARFAEGRER
jgi:hypothetical protein